MDNCDQAQLVIQHLSGIPLYGRYLRLVLSKHTEVLISKNECTDLTKDFLYSPLHRFRDPDSKNIVNIFPPSEVLHLSNIPPEVTEETLREAFSKHAEVQGFKFFAKDRRMALIQLETVEEAVTCLVMMHNYKLTETYHLRVSFSKGHI